MNKRAWMAALLLSLALAPELRAASVGEKAAVFELSGMDGKKTVVNGLKGEVTFLNFWASWCGPCAVEFPALNELAREYKDKGVKVVAVSIDTDRPAADRFLSRFGKDGLNLKPLFDPESKVVEMYGARAMPTSYIIDQKGVIRFIHVGFRPDDTEKWRKEVNDLLKEKK